MWFAKKIGLGMTDVTRRYAEVINKYLPDYDPTKPSNCLMYLDVNNLP